MSQELHWLSYVKKAFVWRWNLLLLGGAAAASLISGHADIALPVVLAAEGIYLASMTANTKFRKAVDAEHRKVRRVEEAERKRANRLNDLLSTLTPARMERFHNLRRQCDNGLHLAARVRGEVGHGGGASQAIDKMLWTFLRLLVSDQALERFTTTTDAGRVRGRIKELKKKLARAQKSGDEKIVRALVDSVATANLRLNNLDRASENAEFVAIELDRIEDKIRALVEMSVGHEDPDFLSSQVDEVAASMSVTEATMKDLSFLPGVNYEESTPEIMREAQLR